MGRSRRRTRSANEREHSKHIKQIPWQQSKNPYPKFNLIGPESLERIHQTSMRILSEAGIRVMGSKAINAFRQAGAIVDADSGLVKIDESIVNQALSTAPSSFTLEGREPSKQLQIGGDYLSFGLVAGPPSVHDRVNGRRSGNYKDYCQFTQLAHYFNAIQIIGNQVCAPQEMPANNRHLDTYLANILYSDLSYHCTAIGRSRALDGIKMMAIARGISLEQMAASPGVITIISVNSPRLLDDAMSEGLAAMAEHGQPVTITPFTLMGAMTPVTLPAALAQQNAEALFGITLTQLINPGAPVMYGAFTSNVDMRSGAPAFGTPENTKANIIAGQLARRYQLPYRSSNANASKTVDLQATYETMMSTWGAVMGGANMVYHAAGWLEGGLCASYEKLILDVEIIQNMMEFMKPIEFNESELGFDAIKSVDTGGHFFGIEHTMERYKTAFYSPMLSDWQNHENWRDSGANEAVDRATNLWQQALNDYQEPVLDQSIREELDAFIAKRKEEIGTAEPE